MLFGLTEQDQELAPALQGQSTEGLYDGLYPGHFRSLGHSVTWSIGHSIIRSLQSLLHLLGMTSKNMSDISDQKLLSDRVTE